MPRQKKGKACSQCGEDKAEDDFYKNRTECKACSKKNRAEYYANNKEACDERSKAWKETNPDKAKEYSKTWQENNPEKFEASKSESLVKYEKNYQAYQITREPGKVLK